MTAKSKFHTFITVYKEALAVIKDPEQFCHDLKNRENENRQSIARTFVLPFLIAITLSIFIGYFINAKHPRLDIAILKAIFGFLSLYAGYYTTVFLLVKFSDRTFKYHINKRSAQEVIAYCSTVLYSIKIIMAFFPSYFFIQLLYFYTFYLLWVFASEFLDINEADRTKFMLIITTVIILIPYLFSKLFQLLIPNVSL